MSKTSVEFELLAPSREKPGGQLPTYSQVRTAWPYDVIDAPRCEFQYRVFRDAYNRLNTDYDTGRLYQTALTDPELRLCWLNFYVSYENPSHQQIASWAKDVHLGKRSGPTNSDHTLAVVLAAVLLLLIFVL